MLIVGLGNPGKKYANTRHNAGYIIIDELSKINKKGRTLFKTETFMNISGKAVKKLIKGYYANDAMSSLNKHLCVIHDDIDIPIGQFKIQKGRGAAGHKGAQSIINELGTKDFWRVRAGVCPKKGKPKNVEKFVLQNFTREERGIIKEVSEKIATQLAELAQDKQKG